jgi:hypothetical protein
MEDERKRLSGIEGRIQYFKGKDDKYWMVMDGEIEYGLSQSPLPPEKYNTNQKWTEEGLDIIRELLRARTESGATPAPGQPGQAVTARDVSNVRIQAAEKYSQYLDTSFELDRARLQLLRATGELEAWAMPSK